MDIVARAAAVAVVEAAVRVESSEPQRWLSGHGPEGTPDDYFAVGLESDGGHLPIGIRVERRVQTAIRIDAGQVIPQLPAHPLEQAPDEYLAIGLNQNGRDVRFVRAGVES